ncbi:transporter [Novosphingobium sp. Leaf2]|uniref:transporter n=1 Tax=Novosphingobium sp. Leaf2 TaxID=1735670 RepID=UPI0006F7447C|nr:transporter [Novosphingobium sp. Leaf2]KQM19457.1 hypothetical protein ASE49_04300 [Novosphingobium sp. Leaf2]
MRIWDIAAAALALLPCTAWAAERDYCPDRPGLDTPPCTMAPGTLSLEAGLGDWTLSRDADQRQDLFLTGDLRLRYGFADHAEVQLGWTSLGFSRTRDYTTGQMARETRTGDVTLGVRRNLANPDGSGFSVALAGFVSLPTGRSPVGAGDWGAGALVPISVQVSDTVSLTSTSELDAAVDDDGNGRHLAVGQTVGAAVKLGEKLSAAAEYQITFDRDPSGYTHQQVSGLSLAWQPAKNLQFDAGTILGLDRDANDVELYFGVSRRF